MNIAQCLEQHAHSRPYDVAISTFAGRSTFGRPLYEHMSYLTLDEKSSEIAYFLRKRGIEPQMRVLLFMKPRLEFYALVFALFRMGAVPVFIDPSMGRTNLLNAVRTSEAKAMIAEPMVHFLAFIFRSSFAKVKIRLKPKDLMFAPSLRATESFPIYEPAPRDLSAILFTSGSTGPSKGVSYTHDMMIFQANAIKEMFRLSEADLDYSAFPFFALFSIVMGTRSILGNFDIRKPQAADPVLLLEGIYEFAPTFCSGSPAVWEKVGKYCALHQLKLPSIRVLALFGAPISKRMHELFEPLLPQGSLYTPYGATECLPLALMSTKELGTLEGMGSDPERATCVGFPVRGTQIKIIEVSDKAIRGLVEKAPFEVGEIIVSGPQVSFEYATSKEATLQSKFVDEHGSLWHRMGDLGFLDAEGRLWFVGRKAHSFYYEGIHYDSVPIEEVFLAHPEVRRAALIKYKNAPAIVLERFDRVVNAKTLPRFKDELLRLGEKGTRASTIKHLFLCESMPVDRRHNIKIDREALSGTYSKSGEKSWSL